MPDELYVYVFVFFSHYIFDSYEEICCSAVLSNFSWLSICMESWLNVHFCENSSLHRNGLRSIHNITLPWKHHSYWTTLTHTPYGLRFRLTSLFLMAWCWPNSAPTERCNEKLTLGIQPRSTTFLISLLIQYLCLVVAFNKTQLHMRGLRLALICLWLQDREDWTLGLSRTKMSCWVWWKCVNNDGFVMNSHVEAWIYMLGCILIYGTKCGKKSPAEEKRFQSSRS